MRGGDAGVAVDLRQPAELDVGVHRLHAEEDGQCDRGRRVDDAPARSGVPADLVLGGGAALMDGEPHPQREGEQREEAPHAEAGPPRPGCLADRRRRHGAEGGADDEPGAVDGHQRDRVAVGLDPGGHEDVADRHPGEPDDGEQEEDRHVARRDAQQQAEGGRRETDSDPGGHPDLAREDHRHGPDDPEDQPRQAGHGAGDRGTHAQPGPQLLEHRSERRRPGSQVDRDQGDGGEEQPEREAGRAYGAARAGVGVRHGHRPC